MILTIEAGKDYNIGDDIDVDVSLSDVLDFVNQASNSEKDDIKDELDYEPDIEDVVSFLVGMNKGDYEEVMEALEGSVWREAPEIEGFDTDTLVGTEKLDLLRIAADKYTLQELEERLGGTIHTL